MSDWTENDLRVRGEKTEVARFVDAVRGVDEQGRELPFSLTRADPLPLPYLNGKRYSDSEEYRDLQARFAALPATDKRDFLAANRGLFAEMMASTIDGAEEEQGAISWRLQHWGTKWELSADSSDPLELLDEDREALFNFNSAGGGTEPAVASLATRYPSLEFDLKTKAGNVGAEEAARWRGGQRVTL